MSRRSVVIFILALTLSRLVVNMGRRFPYPFLPEISRQLAEPLPNVQNVLAAASGIGAASPLFGPLSDRYGRKPMMLIALSLMFAATLLAALLPQFWMFALMMLVFGVTKMIYDPAMQAYVGDRIPYNRRALAIGTTELSWAGALLVAAPLAAFLLDGFGIQAMFAALAVASAFAIIIVWLFVPGDNHADSPASDRSQRAAITPLQAWNAIRRNPAALAAVGYMFMLDVSNEMFFINYGVWMELSFDMVLTALGTVTIVIALAEVIGEFSVLGLADRVGPRRMAMTCAFLSAFAYLALPYLNFSLPATLAGLFLAFLFFETAIVSSIPLFTEIMPQARSAMMSGVQGAASLGRMIGAALGAFIYETTGSFPITCLAATLIGLGAFFLMWRYVQEHHEQTPAIN